MKQSHVSSSKSNRSAQRKEFVKNYIHGSSVLFGETVTEKDAKRAWAEINNAGKKKRVKSKPQMSKEEYFAMSIRNSTLLFGEPPTEEDLNREWELIEIKRHYYTIRGKNKRETEKKRNEFLEQKGQEMRKRDSSTQ